MSQATHAYRNVKNGKVGELTEDQAAIWPDLLVRVDAEPETVTLAPIVTPTFDEVIAGPVETKTSKPAPKAKD